MLLYFLYNIFIQILLPFAWVGAFFNDKLAGSYSGQKEIKAQLEKFLLKTKDSPKPIVWLHAASAGEFEQIKPFLERLSKLDVYVFQTFTSPTIYYKASQNPHFHGVSFLPWDSYIRVNRFIKTLGPSLFLNTRHDIWPNLLRALKSNGVRSILVNGNLYEDSTRLKSTALAFNRYIFGHIDMIYTGSIELKSLIGKLYEGPIEVVGDSRFDQVYERSLNNDSELIPEKIITDQRVIVYGSTDLEDLDVVTEAIGKLDETLKYLHIIVPHEVMERDLTPWEVAFYRHKLKTIRFSELDSYSGESIIIWNQVGSLADLYKVADLAFVGAGFSTGVHSVTEPAIYHVPVAHGPKYDILAEAIELVDAGLSTVVHTAADMQDFLEMSQEDKQHRGTGIQAFVQQRLGATDRIMSMEKTHLE